MRSCAQRANGLDCGRRCWATWTFFAAFLQPQRPAAFIWWRVLLWVAASEMFRGALVAAGPQRPRGAADYRGMMPTFWALLHGDREVIITVHEVVERLDAGGMASSHAPGPVGLLRCPGESGGGA
jgi:hypothetical protein